MHGSGRCQAQRAFFTIAVLALAGGCFAAANAQAPLVALPAAQAAHPPSIALTVVDENGLVVSGALVTVEIPGHPSLHLVTDYRGRCAWPLPAATPYSLRVDKPNFYQASQSGLESDDTSLHIVLTHQQLVQQQVNVTASLPGIDPERISDQASMNTPEIVNIPYPTNIDIRDLLPFTPGVVADFSGQVHVAGSETWMTLDTFDGFDIRNPIYGTLDLRVDTDAVRSLDTESTRYSAAYGRATGGVIAYTTGMGDNKFRYDATDFVPSFRDLNGIRFDTFEPRFTFSGPVRRNRVWFFEAIDTEYNDIYIPELPTNADTDHRIRGSNLLKFQANLGSRNSLTTALLWNDYHSPYEGISALTPQQSTDNHDILAWLPYLRDQQSFRNGVMLDTGFGAFRYSEGFEPHGDVPYDITPELPSGSDFDSTTARSQRLEGFANLYFPARHWHGDHLFRAGVDLDHIGFDENVAYAPINYLREDRTLLRRSVFPSFAPFTRHNVELGAYVEDRWTPLSGLLVQPGLRFDWDEIVRRPLFSPRLAFNYSPPGEATTTKITGGIGIYYGHTQLEYLTRALAGIRYDTYYADDGVTPTGPPLETTFAATDASLHEPRAVNWSIGVQHKLPGQIVFGASFLDRVTSHEFVYATQSGPTALAGNYVLTNNRQDHYHAFEVNARRSFAGNYALFASYARSSATTNSALDYLPTLPILGPQQGGPLFFDTPNRVISWGWLPAWAPKLPTVHKNWDFVYTLLWNTGFPFDSVDDNNQLVGVPGSHRFPDYLSFSPGLEWRFHFHGKYFGLRGVADNIANRANPSIVYNNVDSPDYLTFTQPEGRGFTTRIRLIQSGK